MSVIIFYRQYETYNRLYISIPIRIILEKFANNYPPPPGRHYKWDRMRSSSLHGVDWSYHGNYSLFTPRCLWIIPNLPKNFFVCIRFYFINDDVFPTCVSFNNNFYWIANFRFIQEYRGKRDMCPHIWRQL